MTECSPRSPGLGNAGRWLRLAAVNTLAAITVAVMFTAASGRPFASELISSLIFSHTIGGLAGLDQQGRAVPHQSFGVLGVLGQELLADLHRAVEPRGVAAQAGEEIVADDVVEPLRRRRLPRGRPRRDGVQQNEGGDGGDQQAERECEWSHGRFLLREE